MKDAVAFFGAGKGKDARTLSQLHQQLSEEYGEAYLGTVYYDTASEDWKTQLVAAAENVLRGLEGR